MLSAICMANSLVGTIINALISPAVCAEVSNRCKRGNKKAAVLPVPVCAAAIMSLPSKMGTITCC